MPAISIVTPAFNAAATLARAIRSVRSQTWHDWEWLLVDDGSADETGPMIAACASADSRVVPVVFEANRGPSAARNAALARASGATVVYLDADDELAPGHLARVAALSERADVLVFDYEIVDDRLGRGCGRRSTWSPGLVRDRLPSGRIACPLGVAHQRALIARVGGFDERLRFEEDVDLWRRLFEAGATFEFVAEGSGRYHVRADSLARAAHPQALAQRLPVRAAVAAAPGDGARRFHLLGLPYTRIHRDFCADPFTTKVSNLARMLRAMGHPVTLYAPDGSGAGDADLAVCMERDEFERFFPYDPRERSFDTDHEEAWALFNQRVGDALEARRSRGDVVLNPYGWRLQPACRRAGLLTVEPGVGHLGSLSENFRVFESHAWMNYTYGREQILHPASYDAVIPNGYDLADFPLQPTKQRYLCFVGRLVDDKGWRVACDVAQVLGLPIKLAGHGRPRHPYSGVEHVGSVSIEARAELMGNAMALLAPSQYVEPFGSVVIEALLCGTPVICSDFGAFSETVPQGEVGFRCRQFSDFVHAVRRVDAIDPVACRRYAEDRFSLEVVAESYREYFSRLAQLQAGGNWYSPRPMDPRWSARQAASDASDQADSAPGSGGPLGPPLGREPGGGGGLGDGGAGAGGAG